MKKASSDFTKKSHGKLRFSLSWPYLDTTMTIKIFINQMIDFNEKRINLVKPGVFMIFLKGKVLISTCS